jgi:Stage II sporulation protein E (SpoIIE)
MVSPPAWKGRRRAGRVRGAFVTLQTQLTRQFITRNRRMGFILSAAVIAISVAAVHVSVWWFSPGVMILPILAGGLLMWPRALRIFFAVVAGALIYDLVKGKVGAGIVATIVLTAVFADVLARTRKKLGVQGLRGDRMLLELRDRIQAQGKLPRLGEGWGSSVVLRPAGGSSFGGDFVVSFCDGKTLEVALVDVSGKGIDAGTRALLLSGAFGGLLGSVPREDFLPACNAYMRRGAAAEGFVTAVHLSLDLASGEYVIDSAGHPPAVHYDAAAGLWRLTRARGIVLGVLPDLRGAASETERGVLQRGDALMLYTDGLVEAPGRDIDAGTDRLLGEAERVLSGGFQAGAPGNLVTNLQRTGGGSDDCALVLLWRTLPGRYPWARVMAWARRAWPWEIRLLAVPALIGVSPNSAPVSAACIWAASASRAEPSAVSWFSMPRYVVSPGESLARARVEAVSVARPNCPTAASSWV